MKLHISIIILVFSLISPTFAQTGCADMFAKTTDQMSGGSFVSSVKPIIISSDGGNKGFEISMGLIRDTSALQIRVLGGGDCIQQGNIMIFSFADDTRKFTANQGVSNCEQKAVSFWGAPTDDNETFAKITSTRLKRLRIKTSDSLVEGEFTPEQADALINQLKCLKSFAPASAINSQPKKLVLKRNKATIN